MRELMSLYDCLDILDNMHFYDPITSIELYKTTTGLNSERIDAVYIVKDEDKLYTEDTEDKCSTFSNLEDMINFINEVYNFEKIEDAFLKSKDIIKYSTNDTRQETVEYNKHDNDIKIVYNLNMIKDFFLNTKPYAFTITSQSDIVNELNNMHNSNYINHNITNDRSNTIIFSYCDGNNEYKNLSATLLDVGLEMDKVLYTIKTHNIEATVAINNNSIIEVHNITLHSYYNTIDASNLMSGTITRSNINSLYNRLNTSLF